jgi:hypothetical protein
LFEVSSGTLLWSEAGDTAKIFDVAFTKQTGDYSFMTCGSKHVKFWHPEEKK